jgi:hypothetical protein
MLKPVDLSHSKEYLQKKMNENWEHVENRMNGNREHVENRMNENKEHMEKRINENWEHMEKKMEKLKNSMYDGFLNTLYEAFPEVYNKMDVNLENKYNNIFETQLHMVSILSLLESTNSESQNHDHSLL